MANDDKVSNETVLQFLKDWHDEENEVSGSVGFFTAVGVLATIAALIISVMFAYVAIFDHQTKAEEELAEYQAAALLCGKDNVDEDEFTNGNKQYTCEHPERVAQ